MKLCIQMSALMRHTFEEEIWYLGMSIPTLRDKICIDVVRIDLRELELSSLSAMIVICTQNKYTSN